MGTHIITDRVEQLEDARLKLDYVEGTLKILAAAFEDCGAFSNMNPEDVEKTLSGLNVHVDSIGQELDNIIDSMMKSSSPVDDLDIPEIIHKMHEINHENVSADIYFTELIYFRDKVLDAVINTVGDETLIDVLWDLYLFGVYKGRYGLDQEGEDTEQNDSEAPF